jgi:hypothetical protein
MERMDAAERPDSLARLAAALRWMLARNPLPSPRSGVVRLARLQGPGSWLLAMPGGEDPGPHRPADAVLGLTDADAERVLRGEGPAAPVFEGDLELLASLLGRCEARTPWYAPELRSRPGRDGGGEA